MAAYLVGPGYQDPRTQDWPLVDWKLPAAISALYILGIPVGHRIMRDREPLKLRRFATLHNAFLFALSLYMTVECVTQSYRNFGWSKHLQLWCNRNDPGPTFSDSGYRLARVLWIHYLSKAYEFGDTLIMILKKNKRQVSFLHVYHHATTFFPVWWAVVKYGPGGEAWFCCALNSLIHVGMYGYYFAAGLGLRVGGVKQLITQSQMIQFLLFMTQSVYMLFIKDCYRPRLSPIMLLVQCAIFFALFANFYRQAYLKKRAAPSKGASAKEE
ncbi:hypothetical protein WJX72_009566 [[Myrmecia] bisecta]|uniref:Very-long-chain 3-oxoacyl-CoA synthase n=1 Tax=[Myrmecia] bisecta TaxID=41462 RepID=A0AAW1QGH2_9CHLO